MSASLFDIYWDDVPNERNYRFYVYAEDKPESALDIVYRTDHRESIVNTIKRWADPESKKRWAKKHLGDDKVVELTIAEGDCNWNTSIDLRLDLNTHQVYIRKQGTTEYTKWNGKIVFHRKK
jgi:hypothetical protein